VQGAGVLDGDVVGSDADDRSVLGVEAVKVGCFCAYVGMVVKWERGYSVEERTWHCTKWSEEYTV